MRYMHSFNRNKLSNKNFIRYLKLRIIAAPIHEQGTYESGTYISFNITLNSTRR